MSEDKKPLPPRESSSLQQKKSEVIKDKFLIVAKEKENLETIILDQNDIIKKLEKEKASLNLALNKYSESNHHLKEKLLEFDALRNVEIAELKKKIESLLSDNKKLTAEKDVMLNNLDRHEKNSLLVEKPKLEASLASAVQIQSPGLSVTVQELKTLLDMKDHNLSAAAEMIRQLKEELSFSYAGLRNIEAERNSLKNQLEEFSRKLESPEPEKRYSEEELEQEIDFYSKEILSLKSDTEILTSSIRDKIKEIDSLNKKVGDLGKQLGQRDVALYEKIPFLQKEFQQLSGAIEKKTEENSLFAGELATLNDKLAALTAGLTEQDAFVLEISGNFNREKEHWAAMLQESKSTHNQLEAENTELKTELSSLRSENQNIEAVKNQFETELANLNAQLAGMSSDDEVISLRIGNLESDKLELEAKLSASLQKIEGLEANIQSNLAVLESKDQFIMETSTEIEDLKTELANRTAEKQDIETAKTRFQAELAHLQAGVPDLQAEIALLRSEKHGIETEKNQFEAELASLQAQLDDARSEDTEIRQHIRALQDEKPALELKLTTALQKIEELEADVRSNQAVLESKDHSLAEVNAEIEDMKIMLASLRSSKQDLEVTKNQLEAELENFNASLSQISSEDAEIRQHIRALQDEKPALESKLTTALQKIEELEADVRSNQALLESKDHSLAEVNAEIEDLKIMLASLRSSKQDLEVTKNQLEAELSHLQTGGPDLKEENSLLRSEKDRIETEKGQISAELAQLKVSFDDRYSEDAEIRRRIGEMEDEKLALESRLSTALQKIDEFVADTLSHQTLLESKDRFLMEEKTEREELKAELASLNSEKQKLEAERNQIEDDLAHLRSELEDSREQGRESRQIIENLKAEKLALESALPESRQKIAEMEEEISKHVSAFASHEQLFSDLKSETENSRSAINALDKENTALKERLSKKEQEFSNYASEKSELLKKVSVLEEAFRILRDDNPWVRTTESHTPQRPANIVPAAVYQNEKKQSFPRYALYAVMLVAVIIGLIYFSKHYRFYGITRYRTPVTVDADANLGYREIYDRNTRTADSKSIKLQATIFTESLLRKEENPDLAGLDFNKYIYFRVNINSLEGQLDQGLVRNPLENLKLTEDSNTISTSGYKQIDKIKTFYKRQVPTAITFYCAFPKNALGPDRKDLTLTLSNNGIVIPLVWDVRNLVANKI